MWKSPERRSALWSVNGAAQPTRVALDFAGTVARSWVRPPHPKQVIRRAERPRHSTLARSIVRPLRNHRLHLSQRSMRLPRRIQARSGRDSRGQAIALRRKDSQGQAIALPRRIQARAGRDSQGQATAPLRKTPGPNLPPPSPAALRPRPLPSPPRQPSQSLRAASAVGAGPGYCCSRSSFWRWSYR